MIITKSSGTMFADLGFGRDEAQSLLLRSQTMMAVTNRYNASGLTQAMAAKALGITQPRLDQVLKRKINEFSLDALVKMVTRAGMRVGLSIKPPPRVKAVARLAAVGSRTRAGQQLVAA